MKKSLIYSLLLIVLGSACLLISRTEAAGDTDMELAEKLKKQSVEQSAVCEQTIVDDAWLLQNQAAGRDADLVWEYLDKNPKSVLHQYFSGMYVDEDSQLIILICGEEDTCRKQLAELGLETEYLIKKEMKSYYAIMEELSQINAKISVTNKHVLNGCGTDEEGAFASAYCGYYTDDNRKLVILVLDPGEPAVLEEIRSIDLQTDYQITEGNYLYSHMVSLLEQIQEDLKALEIVCQAGSADEKTEALYEYRPYVLDSYAPSMGCIPVFFRNGPMTDDEKEKCSDLFEEVVGSFEEVFLSYGM